jgi:2-haloacid dehalogenase
MTVEADCGRVEPRRIRTLIFDVLGTVVDEAGSITAELSTVIVGPGRGPQAAAVASTWSQQLESMLDQVAGGYAAWQSNDELRRAALQEALRAHAITNLPASAVEELAMVGHRLRPWPDSSRALQDLARSYALVALSNADLAQLVDMFSAGGLAWHGIASGELVRSYKPDPAVYRMALDRFALNPQETMMVAAHPWDLRAAATHGLRTAYVARPGEGVLDPTDHFDIQADGLAHLATLLTDRRSTVSTERTG